jgi:hypothetical protein
MLTRSPVQAHGSDADGAPTAAALFAPPEPDWDVRGQVIGAQPFYRYVVHDALALLGAADRIAELCRDWDRLLRIGPSAFRETWEGGSFCHGWSATPSRDLVTYVLGITPATPGYERVRVAPRLGARLEWAEGSVPTPHGLQMQYPVAGTAETIGTPDASYTPTTAPYGCVVAYSGFDEPSGDAPSSSALFGTATASGYQILCTNPTALLNGDDPSANESMDTYLPTEQLVNGNVLDPDGDLTLVLAGFTLPTVAAGFEEYQGALYGRCTYQDGASWLQITGDTGLFPSSTQTSGLGLHVVDYNIDLGDLTALVARQAAAWLAADGS